MERGSISKAHKAPSRTAFFWLASCERVGGETKLIGLLVCTGSVDRGGSRHFLRNFLTSGLLFFCTAFTRMKKLFLPSSGTSPSSSAGILALVFTPICVWGEFALVLLLNCALCVLRLKSFCARKSSVFAASLLRKSSAMVSATDVLGPDDVNADLCTSFAGSFVLAPCSFSNNACSFA